MASSSFLAPRKHFKAIEAYLAAPDDQRTDDPIHGPAVDADFAIGDRIRKEIDQRGLEAVSVERRYFAALHQVENGINGDGLSHVVQYEPDLLPAALEACQKLKLPGLGGVLKKLLKVFPNGSFPADNAEAEEFLFGEDEEKILAKLGKLDDQFFAIDPYEPYTEARFKLVAAKPDEFFAP